MFDLKAEQMVFEIGGVRVGGRPGKNPTVLIGSIFYHRQKLLEDERAGQFNKEEAERLIKIQEEFSDKTGNPCMLDVVAASPQAIEKFLDFASGATESPLLIDGTTAAVRIAGLKYAEEAGLLERAIYNSLVPDYKEQEVRAIKEVGIKAAILLTFTMRDFTTLGRVKAAKKLLEVAKTSGIEKPLIDTCVLDIPSLGMACRAIYRIKDELGVPSGCSPHNAISTWKGLKRKIGVQAKRPALASASAIAATAGSDFILYGPIEAAPYVFPVVAMVDAALGYHYIEMKEMLERNHPLYKIP